jgi:hypothetical protein
MSDLWEWVTAVWLGACLVGALVAAKIGFAQHDLMLLGLSCAACVGLAWLVGGPAASWLWRRPPLAAGPVGDGSRKGAHGPRRERAQRIDGTDAGLQVQAEGAPPAVSVSLSPPVVYLRSSSTAGRAPRSLTTPRSILAATPRSSAQNRTSPRTPPGWAVCTTTSERCSDRRARSPRNRWMIDERPDLVIDIADDCLTGACGPQIATASR